MECLVAHMDVNIIPRKSMHIIAIAIPLGWNANTVRVCLISGLE